MNASEEQQEADRAVEMNTTNTTVTNTLMTELPPANTCTALEIYSPDMAAITTPSTPPKIVIWCSTCQRKLCKDTSCQDCAQKKMEVNIIATEMDTTFATDATFATEELGLRDDNGKFMWTPFGEPEERQHTTVEVLSLGTEIKCLHRIHKQEACEEGLCSHECCYTDHAEDLDPSLRQLPEHEDIQELWYGDIIRWYRHQENPPHRTTAQLRTFKSQCKPFRYHAATGTLHRFIEGVNKWVPCVSPTTVTRILKEAHDKAGHFNGRVVYQKILCRAWWPAIITDIHNYIKGCIRCNLWNTTATIPQPYPSAPILHPNEVLEIDLMGPFDPQAHGMR
ncbi:unnamed protein product [Zymoseptoria tritici ST99CH_1A5]|uniref:Integrase zinc-binding domain-containing protein n=1 Tax=Zymoseptoria tritici ST99CH_1A5 TaxID=1276529 RepID=A0A1Y6M162_ZYMTR|nr:unnamed protein product [Zymoseptoria tritici ST99CH_1A5]